MSCSNSVTTETGTFTFYDEVLTLCEAKVKCAEKGEILGQVTNKQDANEIMKLFKSNAGKENCEVVTYFGVSYWVGLNVTFTEAKQEKVFFNGEVWNEKIHSKIYTDYNKKYTNCPMALFQPFYPPDPFCIVLESPECNIKKMQKYFCLKPKVDKSAESITQDKDSLKHVLTELTGSVFAVTASVVLMIVVGVFAFVRLHIKNKRLAKKYEDLKLEHEQVTMMRKSLMNSSTAVVNKETI